jgi:hypothetical protein
MQAMPQTSTSASLSKPSPTPMDRVRRIAGLMRGMVLVGGTLFTIAALAMWATPEWLRLGVSQQVGIDPGSVTITPTVQFYGALISLVPVGIGIFGMVQVWFLFGEYAQGRIFTAMASQRLRRLAWSLIGAAAAQIIARTLHGLVLTMNNPPGKKLLILNVSSNDYSFLIFGVLLLGIAWVMVEATRLAQENAEFI